MNSTILTIVSLSVSGSILALAVLLMRLVKNKVSKTFRYYIWLLVLLRLALPLSFDGSIMNQILSQTAMAQTPGVSLSEDSAAPTEGFEMPQGNGQNAAEIKGSDAKPNPVAPSVPARFDILQFAIGHQSAIWLLGASIHFGWFIVTYLRFVRKLKKTSFRPHPKDKKVFVELRGNANVQLACNPYIDTPLLIGFPSPCVIIPNKAFVENNMEEELRHILLHELTHYRRRDLLYKWFAVLVSSLHWFNPMMILVRREIGRACELSCDEAVIRSLDAPERQGYGKTLLAIASNRRLPSGVVTTTMCEEKRELKERLEGIMTYKKKSVLTVALTLVLTALLAGCSVALGAANTTTQTLKVAQSPTATINNQTPDATPAQAASTATPSVTKNPSPTSGGKIESPVLEAYKAVLQNKSEFMSIDNKRNLYLNDFLSNKEIYDTAFKATRFTVLDMDGDKVPEVVLELSVGDSPEFYEVLHYYNGIVRGYLIVYRGLEGLKADGTFRFSSGAADSGCGKMKFLSDAAKTDALGYSQSLQGDPNLSIAYYVDSKSVTKSAFDSFMNQQSAKKNATWYGFSQKNIDTALSAN